MNDPKEVISEREAFLLRELQTMLLEEELLGSSKDTVVVAARHAWTEYQRFHAYVCQPGRSFQPVQYLAFYAAGQVYPLIPRITAVKDEVVFEPGRHSGPMGYLVEQLLEERLREAGTSYKVFLLSAPDDPQTIHLESAILNNLRSATGRPSAFTQGQRNVRLIDLVRAEHTSDLVHD